MLISTLNYEMWPNFSYRGVRSVQLLLLLLLLMVFSSENFGFSPPYAGIAGIGPVYYILQCSNGSGRNIHNYQFIAKEVDNVTVMTILQSVVNECCKQ